MIYLDTKHLKGRSNSKLYDFFSENTKKISFKNLRDSLFFFIFCFNFSCKYSRICRDANQIVINNFSVMGPVFWQK